MNNQTIKLDLVPGGVPRTINVSQYDTGARVLTFELYAGTGTIDVSGATAKIYGRKPDGIGFEYDCTISGSTVTADCTEQMTAVPGTVDCALTLTDSDGRAQTARFNLEVKPNPLNDGTVVSETDIALLQQAIDASEEALQSAEDAEAWANGGTGGTPSATDNAKYWAEQSQAYAIGAFHWKASVAFANIPTTGLTNGDVYNITDAFTTDSRFVEGSGIKCAAGTNIVWSGSLWDILTPNTTAAGTSYDNTTSGATSSNVQGALDEAFSDIDGINTALGSTDISAIGDGSVTGAISTINTNLSVLLWTNSSSGEFVTQDVSVDLSNYSKVKIITNEGLTFIFPVDSETHYIHQYPWWSNGSLFTAQRGLTYVSANKVIAFQTGTHQTGSTISTDNYRSVPKYIYGIR